MACILFKSLPSISPIVYMCVTGTVGLSGVDEEEGSLIKPSFLLWSSGGSKGVEDIDQCNVELEGSKLLPWILTLAQVQSTSLTWCESTLRADPFRAALRVISALSALRWSKMIFRQFAQSRIVFLEN